MKTRKTVKSFGPLPAPLFSGEAAFRALQPGDRVRVRLEGSEVRPFRGFGTRSPLAATERLGFDYGYFFVEGDSAREVYAVDRSRLEEISPF